MIKKEDEMTNQQNPYNQSPQMGQPMMPPPMPRQRVRNNGGWRTENGYWGE